MSSPTAESPRQLSLGRRREGLRVAEGSTNPADDKTVTLQSGTSTYTRTFVVPTGTGPGSYDVAWGFLGTDMQTSYGLRVKDAGVQVGAPRQIAVGSGLPGTKTPDPLASHCQC